MLILLKPAADASMGSVGIFAPRCFGKKAFVKSFSKNSVNSLTRSALIAAIYLLLTLIFQPISFGALQFRIAEALMLLPVLCPDAVGGLFIGCLLANLLGGGVWFDVVFGSIATLAAAVCVRRLRRRPWLAALAPVLLNGAIVGPVVYLGYIHSPSAAIHWPTLLSTVATVALGELAVCCALGLPMLHVLKRLPEELFEADQK